MNMPTALSLERRQALSALFREARIRSNRTQQEVADAVYALLPGDVEPVSRQWVCDCELTAPRRFLSDFPRMDALILVSGLTWPQVLWTLGARASMERPS